MLLFSFASIRFPGRKRYELLDSLWLRLEGEWGCSVILVADICFLNLILTKNLKNLSATSVEGVERANCFRKFLGGGVAATAGRAMCTLSEDD